MCILAICETYIGVVVLHKSMLNWRGVHLPWVDVHSAIYEADWVKQCCIDLWSIGGGGPWYMCILLYMKLIWCSCITQIYGQLEEGALVCAFFYM